MKRSSVRISSAPGVLLAEFDEGRRLVMTSHSCYEPDEPLYEIVKQKLGPELKMRTVEDSAVMPLAMGLTIAASLAGQLLVLRQGNGNLFAAKRKAGDGSSRRHLRKRIEHGYRESPHSGRIHRQRRDRMDDVAELSPDHEGRRLSSPSGSSRMAHPRFEREATCCAGVRARHCDAGARHRAVEAGRLNRPCRSSPILSPFWQAKKRPYSRIR